MNLAVVVIPLNHSSHSITTTNRLQTNNIQKRYPQGSGSRRIGLDSSKSLPPCYRPAHDSVKKEKKIDLILPAHLKPIYADPFHFENAISNLVDNAIKYGGNEIRICLDQSGMNKVRIYDNGGNISSEQKERVFEQFYRIPKGDLHDVKGFGIGLYYVKKILEKHEGKIELEIGKQSTTFITFWP